MSSESEGRQGGSSNRSQEFQRVSQAVKRLGFEEEAVNTMWKVLAAVLHLGNLDFIPEVQF